ncbi:hypothetical protein [Roseisolibacter agri]|uniref:Uncharacterized protein n=1 Tax=Roseisolibacter agri TaxID=2014610 RepID=A0AA37VA38_9BACT|nr:hypothetical protein [Roseisolibacter agri]GLC25048.1 hypothetical protein rosag_15610 [Roseisolibacter agri]
METTLAREILEQVEECTDELRLARLRRVILAKYSECENRRRVLAVLAERAAALRQVAAS